MAQYLEVTYPALEAEFEQRADDNEDIVDADEHVPEVAKLQLVPDTEPLRVVHVEEMSAQLHRTEVIILLYRRLSAVFSLGRNSARYRNTMYCRERH